MASCASTTNKEIKGMYNPACFVIVNMLYTLLDLLQKAIQALLEDASFRLDTTPARSAYSIAEKLVEYGLLATNKTLWSTSKKLYVCWIHALCTRWGQHRRIGNICGQDITHSVSPMNTNGMEGTAVESKHYRPQPSMVEAAY